MKTRGAVTTEQLWAAYQQLGTAKAVADRFGYKGHNNVVQRLNKAGYKLHHTGRRRKNVDPAVLSLFAQLAEEVRS